MKRGELSGEVPLLRISTNRGKANPKPKVVGSVQTHPESSKSRTLTPSKTNRMSANSDRDTSSTSLLGNNWHQSGHSQCQFDDRAGEPRLSTLADQLGIDEIDTLQNFSSSRSQDTDSSKSRGRKRPQSPTIVLTQEQVDTLIEKLESTGEALKQLTLHPDEYRPPKRRRIPVWITTHLFAITTIWQFACIMALTVLEGFTKNKKKERSTFILTVAILVLFQSTNLLLVFFTSVKLTKQFMHQTVTRSFLGQSYLSMTLLFAGLYTLVYRIDKGAAFKDLGGLDVPDDVLSSVILFAKMLFYSISMATLCGTGHVIAATWYSQMISALQMLTSYVYFASVLSIAVHPPKKIKYMMNRGASVNPSGKTYGAIRHV